MGPGAHGYGVCGREEGWGRLDVPGCIEAPRAELHLSNAITLNQSIQALSQADTPTYRHTDTQPYAIPLPYTHTHTHKHTFTLILTHKQHACTLTHMHIKTHTHTHTHTQTHTVTDPLDPN